MVITCIIYTLGELCCYLREFHAVLLDLDGKRFQKYGSVYWECQSFNSFQIRLEVFCRKCCVIVGPSSCSSRERAYGQFK